MLVAIEVLSIVCAWRTSMGVGTYIVASELRGRLVSFCFGREYPLDEREYIVVVIDQVGT